MSESEPPAERPPMATRATPRTVRVRRDDYVAELIDEPTGPPIVLFWFRLMCVLVALVAFVVAPFALARAVDEEWRSVNPPLLLSGCLAAFVAYTLPLWWRRPQRWHWIYGMVLILIGLLPPITLFSTALIVFWFQPKTVRFFRHPPPSYTPATTLTSTDTTSVTGPPGVLFALRWLCMIGCGACMITMPITAGFHATEPNAGWSAMWWLGGFAGGFLLFVVPLFVRTPRRWVWWYGVVLLVLCSLSLYFTLLAVPTLVFWLMKRPREYFAGRTAPPAAL